MPIPVACPGCSARLNAPDAAAGKRVKCPKCQTPIPVPAPAAFEEVEDDEPAEEVTERPRPKPRRRDDEEEDEVDDRPRKRRKPAAKSGGLPAAVWVAGGLGLAAAIGVAVWLTLGDKKGKDDAPAAGSGGGVLEKLGLAGGDEAVTLKPGEKKEVRRALATVQPGPDGWARIDDPVHGFRGELPGRAFPTAMSENNPKVVADRGYRWAEWHTPIASAANGPDTKVSIYRRTAADPYPTAPAELLAAVRVARWDAFNPDNTGLTTIPVTVDGRPGIEVRFHQPTFNERVAKQDPKAEPEPDDPKDVPDHTVLRAAADGRWLYVVHFRFSGKKPDEAVMKRVFESVKLNPPAGP